MCQALTAACQRPQATTALPHRARETPAGTACAQGSRRAGHPLLAAAAASPASSAAPEPGALRDVGVAVGAVKECIESAVASWQVCGFDVVSGNLPLFLNLPDPTGASMSIERSRLSSASDDARLSPIGVPTSSPLRLIVSFADGSTRDLSTDSRVSYATTDAGCATVASNTLSIAAGATCQTVVVVATVSVAVVAAATSKPMILGRSLRGVASFPRASTP